MSEWSNELPARPGWYVYLGQLDALPTLILLVLAQDEGSTTPKDEVLELYDGRYFDVSRHVGLWLEVTLPKEAIGE